MLPTRADEDLATARPWSEASDDHDIFALIHSHETRGLKSALNDMDTLHVRDSTSRTPLMHAIFLSDDLVRIQVIRLLLRHGCDVNAQDDRGRTALMYACMDVGKTEMVRQLVKCRNCDPNMYDTQGNTALMHCVRNGNSSAIKILTNHVNIKHRLRINLVNRSGRSALEMAIQAGLKDCCRILLKDGEADTSRVKHHGRVFLKSIEDDPTRPNQSQPDSVCSQQSGFIPRLMTNRGFCYTSNNNTLILAGSDFNPSFRNDAGEGIILENDSGDSPRLTQDITATTALSTPVYPHCSAKITDKNAFFKRRSSHDEPDKHEPRYQPDTELSNKPGSLQGQAPEAEPSTSLSMLQTSSKSDSIPNSICSVNKHICSKQTVNHLHVNGCCCPQSPKSCTNLHGSGTLLNSNLFSPEGVSDSRAEWNTLPPLNLRARSRFVREVIPMTVFSPLPRIPHDKSE